MIGKLTGTIDFIAADHVILDVGGVGYIVFASSRTLSHIGAVGDGASLLIQTQVREDAITLFGFISGIEQQWFKLLTSVQGVGAKAGLSILSACAAEELAFIIAAQDKATLTRADGIGPKIAMRLLTELKDKAAGFDISRDTVKPLTGKAQTAAPSKSSVDQDAVSALTNLGYAAADAYRAVMDAKGKTQEQDNLQTLIRLALKELSA